MCFYSLVLGIFAFTLFANPSCYRFATSKQAKLQWRRNEKVQSFFPGAKRTRILFADATCSPCMWIRMSLVEKFNVRVMPTYTGISSDKHAENYLTRIPFIIYIYLCYNDECIHISPFRFCQPTPSWTCLIDCCMMTEQEKNEHIQDKTRIDGNNKQKNDTYDAHTHNHPPTHSSGTNIHNHINLFSSLFNVIPST